MSWMNKLGRRLEPFAIPNITLYLVIGQTFAYLANMLGLIDPRVWILWPALVLNGEPWRLVTFIFLPPNAHWAFIAFALYMIYFTGGALEEFWGTLRYNLFLFCGYALTVGVAFFAPEYPATNFFIAGSIFLAFAYVNPDFQLQLFFILPVKVKWLALLTWLYFGYTFVTGGWGVRLGVLAAVGNFLIFFARDIVTDIRSGQRRMKAQSKLIAAHRHSRNRPPASGCRRRRTRPSSTRLSTVIAG